MRLAARRNQIAFTEVVKMMLVGCMIICLNSLWHKSAYLYPWPLCLEGSGSQTGSAHSYQYYSRSPPHIHTLCPPQLYNPSLSSGCYLNDQKRDIKRVCPGRGIHPHILSLFVCAKIFLFWTLSLMKEGEVEALQDKPFNFKIYS